MRYAETAGHEFDYEIPNAFRYRDYVIRAFNLDVPVRPARRRAHQRRCAGNRRAGTRRKAINESAIGAGFYFLGEGTHSPVDIREEQMRRIDNQLDVFSKTFLGLTLACARCHDHKFDPITSQGLLRPGGLPGELAASAGFPRPTRAHRPVREAASRASKTRSRAILASARDQLPEPLRSQAAALAASVRTPHPRGSQATPAAAPAAPATITIGCSTTSIADRFDGWFVTGDAFGDRPTRAGDFRFDRRTRHDARWSRSRPGLAHSGMVSDRLQGVLRSRSFTIESRYIHFLAAARGAGSASSSTGSRRSARRFMAG